MARLWTMGFETGIPSATAVYDSESDNTGTGTTAMIGTVAYQATVTNIGGIAMRCDPSAANYQQVAGPVLVLDQPIWVRFYVRLNDITPTTTSTLLQWRLNAIPACEVQSLANGTMILTDANGTQIGSAFTPTVDTWHMVEVKMIVPTAGNGTLEWRVDGTQISTSAAADVNNTVATPRLRIGHQTAGETSQTVYIDDVAVNDSNGANQNDYPGSGHVTMLIPASDDTKGTGWEGPQTTGSDTTNLFDNVNNFPPLGVAHADTDANANKYAFNAANLGAASDFRVACLAASFFLPTGAPIMLSCAYMRASCDSTTGTNNMELQGITPSDSAITANVELTAVAGTEPTGWKSFRTAVTYRPSLALATSPIVEATKILTGAARAHMVDQMGLMIEWRYPVERSTALSATASIATSGEVETPVTVVERSASLSATAAIATAPQRALQRSTALSASANIASAPQRDLQRSASASATAAIAVSAFNRDLQRAAAASATATITAAALQRDLLRSASVSATGAIAAIGEFETPSVAVERSASLNASAAITTSGLHILVRSASLSATAAVSTAYTRELLRSAALLATAGLDAGYQRELLRSIGISATADILTDGVDIGIFTSAASLSALAAISSSGAKVLPWNYGGGTLATYSGDNDFTYAGGTASTYGADPDWTYGGTASPTYTYGG